MANRLILYGIDFTDFMANNVYKQCLYLDQKRIGNSSSTYEGQTRTYTQNLEDANLTLIQRAGRLLYFYDKVCSAVHAQELLNSDGYASNIVINPLELKPNRSTHGGAITIARD
jgi:hypothetical protein